MKRFHGAERAAARAAADMQGMTPQLHDDPVSEPEPFARKSTLGAARRRDGMNLS